MSNTKVSEINLTVHLNEKNIPEKITWQALDTEGSKPKNCKAFLLSIWDDNPQDAALRMDLWTKEMRTDEMNKLFFQTFMTMAETYRKANGNEALSNEIKAFGYEFGKKSDLLK